MTIIARVLATAMLLLFAAANFFSGVLLPRGPLNPFGLVCLAISGALWFGWETIEDVDAYQEKRRRAGRQIPSPLLVKFAPQLGTLPSRRTLPSLREKRRMHSG